MGCWIVKLHVYSHDTIYLLVTLQCTHTHTRVWACIYFIYLPLPMQFERDIGDAYRTKNRKLTQELFELETQHKALEEKLANTVAADKMKAERIREMDQEHRRATETLQRAARQSSRQQMEELEETKRKGLAKDKELLAVSEQLSRVQADKEHLEEELARMRKAEAWVRADPRASPQSSLSPPDSPVDGTPVSCSSWLSSGPSFVIPLLSPLLHSSLFSFTPPRCLLSLDQAELHQAREGHGDQEQRALLHGKDAGGEEESRR